MTEVEGVSVRRLLWVTMVVGLFLVAGGFIFGVTIQGTVSQVKDYSAQSTCRAIAAAEYDDLRDQRSNLLADGLLAVLDNDEKREEEIKALLTEVRRKIDEQPSKAVLYQNKCP